MWMVRVQSELVKVQFQTIIIKKKQCDSFPVRQTKLYIYVCVNVKWFYCVKNCTMCGYDPNI